MGGHDDIEALLKGFAPTSAGRDVKKRVLGAVEERHREGRALSPALRRIAAGCGLLIVFALGLDMGLERSSRGRLAGLGIMRTDAAEPVDSLLEGLGVELFLETGGSKTADWLKRSLKREAPARDRLKEKRILEFEEAIDAI